MIVIQMVEGLSSQTQLPIVDLNILYYFPHGFAFYLLILFKVLQLMLVELLQYILILLTMTYKCFFIFIKYFALKANTCSCQRIVSSYHHARNVGILELLQGALSLWF